MLDGFNKSAYASFCLNESRYIQAVSVGMEALDLLKGARKGNPMSVDIDFFLGLYECARAELRQRLWWILFWYPGSTQQGIARLQHSARNGRVTRWSSSIALVDIYLNEKRYTDAARQLELLQNRFASSRFVLWAQTRYFTAKDQPLAAAEVFETLSLSYRGVPYGLYNAFLTGMEAAQHYANAGKYDEAVQLCEGLLSSAEQQTFHERDKVVAQCRTLLRRSVRDKN
jgi:tetratricopeptide (TPR) repeat protein